jgi:hypothetical protein
MAKDAEAYVDGWVRSRNGGTHPIKRCRAVEYPAFKQGPPEPTQIVDITYQTASAKEVDRRVELCDVVIAEILAHARSCRRRDRLERLEVDSVEL